jgi:hypothetical protein
MMLHDKYQSFMPCGFIQKDFQCLFSKKVHFEACDSRAIPFFMQGSCIL